MKLNNVTQSTFTARLPRIKSTHSIVLDGQPRKLHETVVYKKGIPYFWGRIKSIVNILRGNYDAPDTAIISRRQIIPDYRIVNKQGMIDVVPTQVAGEFNMKNGNNVHYYSPDKGTTYVTIKSPKKPDVMIRMYGGERQGTTSAEIKHYLKLTDHILDEMAKNPGKLEKETEELIQNLFKRG